MIPRRRVPTVCRVLTTMMIIFGIIFSSGCSDSEDAAAVNQAAESVDQAGRMILAARQIDLQALQETAADSSFGEMEKAIQLLAGQLKDLDSADEEGLLELTRGLNALSDHLVSKLADVTHARPEHLQRRLKRAQKLLEDAAVSAPGPARAAPNLLLGTLHLAQARESRERLNEMKQAVQGRHIELLQLADQIITETGHLGGLPGQFPRDQIIEGLTQQIDGDTQKPDGIDSLQLQLVRSEEKRVELEQRQKAFQQSLDQLTETVREKHARYIDLLEQAKSVRGEQRYAMQNEAYAVRSGIDSEGKGLSYYSALAESEQFNLDRTKVLLEIEKSRQEQLQKQIAAIRKAITELENSPLNQDIATGQDKSRGHLEELVSQALALMVKLDESEAKYFAARKEVVSGYRAAKAAYKKAVSQSGQLRSYAESMVQRVSCELSNAAFSYDNPETYPLETAGLWQEEAYFYNALAELTGVLATLPPLQAAAAEYRDAYAGKAEQATYPGSNS